MRSQTLEGQWRRQRQGRRTQRRGGDSLPRRRRWCQNTSNKTTCVVTCFVTRGNTFDEKSSTNTGRDNNKIACATTCFVGRGGTFDNNSGADIGRNDIGVSGVVNCFSGDINDMVSVRYCTIGVVIVAESIELSIDGNFSEGKDEEGWLVTEICSFKRMTSSLETMEARVMAEWS